MNFNKKEIVIVFIGMIIGGITFLLLSLFLDIYNHLNYEICIKYILPPIIIGSIIGGLISSIINKNNKLKELNKELKYLSSTDPLTKTINRRNGLEILEKEINKAKRNKKNLMIAFIDINKLKHVNDTYGHNEGDKYIIKINQVIKQTLRKTEYIIRLGGDEFLIIFDNKNSLQSVKKILNRIKMKIENLNKTNIKPYKMGFCYGIAQYKYTQEINISKLLHLADKEMYLQKKKNLKI